MLNRKATGLILVMSCTSFMQPCRAQPEMSQTYNSQGCDALVKHDYDLAEKLFKAAYADAERHRDVKRMITASTNLEALYNKLGKDKEAEAVGARIQNLKYGVPAPVTNQADGFQQTNVFPAGMPGPDTFNASSASGNDDSSFASDPDDGSGSSPSFLPGSAGTGSFSSADPSGSGSVMDLLGQLLGLSRLLGGGSAGSEANSGMAGWPSPGFGQGGSFPSMGSGGFGAQQPGDTLPNSWYGPNSAPSAQQILQGERSSILNK